MSKIDFERAAMLLSVVESQSKVGPQFTAIGQEAMAELKAMNDTIVEANAPKAKPVVAAPVVEPKAEPTPVFPKSSGVVETPVERRA